MKKMLVADDTEMNRSILHEIFSSQYEIIQTTSSEVAYGVLTQYKSALSIVIINENIAKNLSAKHIETLSNFRIFDNVPVVLIINGANIAGKSHNVELPFSDVIPSPVNPFVIKKRVANLVELYSHKTEMEALIEKQTAKILAQNKALKLQQRKINTINNDMLDTLSTVIEYRDVESGKHIHRIKKFTEVMLRSLAVKYPKYNMTEERINLIASASSLHDIGKIAIPDSILLSPRRLTYEEFNIMKAHTVKGCDLLNQLDSVERNEYFTYCYDICRYHHEKFDGRGYPDGLKGNQIPIWAQVVSVADCYDALTSDRPYKAAFSHEQAVEMIRTGVCGAFSDEMMDCFSSVLPEFRRLAEEYADINHSDSNISARQTKEAGAETADAQNIYNKMDRADLIRTIESQKAEMEEAARRDNDILNKISDFVFEFDLNKDMATERKGSFGTLFGYAPKNYSEAVTLFTGICPDEFHSKLVRTMRVENLMKELQAGNDRVVLECPMKAGGDIYQAVRCTLVPVADEARIFKVFLSIQTLNYSSVTAGLGELNTDKDTVTGLWNFNGLQNEVTDFIEHSGKNGQHLLVLVDIDGFRSINRRTGYRFGNEILRDIAEVLKQNFNDSNIIGRVEDDNFIVFIKDCPNREEGIAAVDNIFRRLHKTYTFNEKTYPEITASIGISSYPKHGITFEELFSKASKAVDIAKINGKDMYLFYNEAMRDNWELSVPSAATGELITTGDELVSFEKYFIPTVDSLSDRIISYVVIENSSEYRNDFHFDELYSALHENRNITAVSLNSVRRIFAAIYELEQEGLPLPRLSVVTMFKGGDTEIVIKALDDILRCYPVNCSNICLNITQDMLSTMDMRQLAEFSEYLKGKGFELGVYNVGLESISTKCFTNRLFDRVTIANSFLHGISDGLVPVEILVYLIDCFTGLGTQTLLPFDAEDEIIRQLRQKTDISFGIHTDTFIALSDFKASLSETRVAPEYLALEHERNSLVLSDQLYDEILEQTRSFIMEWIPRLDNVKFSGSFEKMYGYNPDGFDFVRNIRDKKLIHPDDIKKFLEKLNFSRSEITDAECLIRIFNMKTGEYVWNKIHFVSVRNAAGVPSKIMAVCADVSEERLSSAEEELKNGRTDFITRLYNKSATENKIKKYLYDEGVSAEHSLIIAELCGMEEIENCLGKKFANAVLKRAAENIKDMFRDSDIIGRVHGYQFVIFVKGLSSEEVLRNKAEQIRTVVNTVYNGEEGSFKIIGKIGISLFPRDGRSYDELYESALKALYFAKHSVNLDVAIIPEQNKKELPE